MFGTYRLILAFLVVVTHIGKIEVIGGLAVWAFFMLSGFLITGVLNSRYGFTSPGLTGFAISRVLRLYPTYWAVAGSMYLLAAYCGSEVDPSLINAAFKPLEGFREWFSGIFIVGHTVAGLGRVEHALSPPIWAVDVELWLYFISCIWASRSVRAATFSFLACLLLFPGLWAAAKLFIGMGYQDYGGQLIYSFIPAALLPYGLGSLLWFMRDKFLYFRPMPAGLLMGSIMITVLGLWLSHISVTAAYILSLPVFAYLTLVLSRARLSGRLKKLDDLFGHMSYPMYLTHYVCAYVIVVAAARLGFIQEIVIAPNEIIFSYTVLGFVVIAAFTCVVSALIAILLESPMDNIRHMAARRVAERFAERK